MHLLPDPPRPEPRRRLTDIGLDPETPPIRRTLDGGIDYDWYLERAKTLRATTFGNVFARLGRAFSAPARHLVRRLAAAWRDWLARRRAIDELWALDHRSFRDLGLNRAGIFRAVDYGREDVPPPANLNVEPTRAEAGRHQGRPTAA